MSRLQRLHEIVLDMRCDGYGDLRCPRAPTWAPRICVPHSLAGAMPPLRMMTDAHYCDFHRLQFNVQDHLTPAVKARFEAAAPLQRGNEFKCDFEKAYFDRVRINTPEYRAWLAKRMQLAG